MQDVINRLSKVGCITEFRILLPNSKVIDRILFDKNSRSDCEKSPFLSQILHSSRNAYYADQEING